MRRAAVGLGRAHLRCHEEDAQQTFRESDGDRGARLAGMSARMRSPWGPDHHVHSKLGAHLHLVVVSILVKVSEGTRKRCRPLRILSYKKARGAYFEIGPSTTLN